MKVQTPIDALSELKQKYDTIPQDRILNQVNEFELCEYHLDLIGQVWWNNEDNAIGFGGRRPFANSDWEWDMVEAITGEDSASFCTEWYGNELYNEYRITLQKIYDELYLVMQIISSCIRDDVRVEAGVYQRYDHYDQRWSIVR